MKKLILTIFMCGLFCIPTYANSNYNEKEINDLINKSNVESKLSLIKITFKGFDNGFIKDAIRVNKIKIEAYRELQNIYKDNPKLNMEFSKLIELYEEDTQYKIEMYNNKEDSQISKFFPVLFVNDFKATMINDHIKNINNMIDEL